MTTALPIPDVYLDSSVLVDTLFLGLPHFDASDAFCARLANDGSRVYFSQLLRLEVGEAIRRLATNQQLSLHFRQEYRLSDWTTDATVRQRWMTYGLSQFDRLLGTFADIVEIPFRHPLWLQSIPLIGKYGLRATDAVHAATALQMGLRSFATNDGDFRRVAALDVIIVRDEFNVGETRSAP